MTGKRHMVALSLGGGVQSTALALLLDRGLLPGYPQPDLAVFADTQWEPRAVYDNIEWLKTELSYPVVVATAGNLRQTTHRFRTHTGHTGFTDLPLFTDGGIMKRQCTRHYKIVPIQRAINAVATSQRRRHQGQHLVARVRPTRRISQVNVAVNQLGQTQVLGQGDRQEQPSIGHQTVIVKGDLDAVGLLMW